MPNSPTETYTYVDCPACNRRISHPFPLTDTPIPYVHYNRRGPDCRLIVVPGAIGNDAHVHRVPSNQSLESALDDLVRRVA